MGWVGQSTSRNRVTLCEGLMTHDKRITWRSVRPLVDTQIARKAWKYAPRGYFCRSGYPVNTPNVVLIFFQSSKASEHVLPLFVHIFSLMDSLCSLMELQRNCSTLVRSKFLVLSLLKLTYLKLFLLGSSGLSFKMTEACRAAQGRLQSE